MQLLTNEEPSEPEGKGGDFDRSVHSREGGGADYAQNINTCPYHQFFKPSYGLDECNSEANHSLPAPNNKHKYILLQ